MVFADRGETISGGNFHGEYPAKVLDYLAIGIHEIASMSERRIERLCNPSKNIFLIRIRFLVDVSFPPMMSYSISKKQNFGLYFRRREFQNIH
jgi:histidine ammonia-lyase